MAESTSLEEELEAVAARLAAEHEDVSTGKMFSAAGMRTDPGDGGKPKFFAFAVRGRLALKLPEERVAGLIAEGLGEPMSAGKPTPMREWVTVVPAGEDELERYAREAREFVRRAA